MASFFDHFFKERPPSNDAEVTRLQNLLSFTYSQRDHKILSFLKQQEDPELYLFLETCLGYLEDEMIPVIAEIELLKSYLSLVQRYHEPAFSYTFDSKISANECRLYPFTLLPLVQNAVYHGYAGMGRFPVRCRLTMVNNVLRAEISNRSNPYLTDQSDTLIIKALRGRLLTHYPDRHEMLCNSNSNTFKCMLALSL